MWSRPPVEGYVVIMPGSGRKGWVALRHRAFIILKNGPMSPELRSFLTKSRMATAEKLRMLQTRGLNAKQERRALAMELLKLGGKSTTVLCS